MNEYRESAEKIIEAVGGLENIKSYEHCMTRLRLVLVDESLVSDDLKTVPKVKGVALNVGQHQIILGTGVVNKVYAEVDKMFKEAGKENQVSAKGGNIIQKISRLFGDIFIPIIPAIIVSGILMGLRSCLTGLGYLATDTAWYTVLALLIDTGFTYIPVMVGFTAAKKFGGNPIYGMLIGLMVISSSLPAGAAVGKGTAEALQVPFFGGLFSLSVKGYQGSVMIAVLGGYLVTVIEKFIRKYVPNIIDMIVTPILTLGITLFVILFVFGPVVQAIESGFVAMFEFVLALPLGIGGFITAALQQVLVITGMHHGLWIIDISMLESGLNYYQPIRNASIMGQAGACLAFALFAKDKVLKANSGASTVSAMFGITEPALFGTTLKYGMPFVFGCIGAGFAGMYANIVGLGASGMGAACIPGLLYFIGDSVAMTHYLVSSFIGIGVAFALTFVWIKKNKA